jgi:hypothetical protein
MKDMFGITEITEKYVSSRRAEGFYVRLGWSEGRPSVSAGFNNKQFGSREKALEAAVVFRDNELGKLQKAGKWPVEKVLTKPMRNNKSGVLGVSRTRQWSRGKPSKDIYVWQASWHDPETKKPVNAKFSERKWGAEVAFDMACACREAKKNIYASM